MFFLNSTVNEIRSKKPGVKGMSSMGFDPFQNRLIALSSLGVFYTINCINQLIIDRNGSLDQHIALIEKRPKKGKTSFLNESSFSFVRSKM